MGKESRCPYCLDDLVGKDQRVVRCVLCRTPHHQACFEEHGGCTAFGCNGRETGQAGKSIIMATRPVLVLGAAWRAVPLMGEPSSVVNYRSAKHVASDDGATTRSGVRISIARPNLHPGDDLKVRVVVALLEPCRVRWLELRIFDEPRRAGPPPVRLLTARLLGRQPLTLKTLARSVAALAAPAPRLAAGRHPFEVEVPRLFGSVIAQGYDRSVTVSAVLEPTHGPTLASPRVPLLLTFPSAPAPFVPREVPEAVFYLPERREGPPPPASHMDQALPAPAALPRETGRRERIAALEGAGHTVVQRPYSASEDPWREPHHGGAWPSMGAAPPPAVSGPSRAAPPAVAGGGSQANLIAPPGPDTERREPAAPAAPAAPVNEQFPPLSELVDLPPLAVTPPVQPEPAPREMPITVRKRETVRFHAEQSEPEPAGKPGKGPPPVFSASAGPPPPSSSEGPSGDGSWSILSFRAESLTGARTGRVLRARFAARSDVPPLRLSLETPARLEDALAPVVDLSIDAPWALETLDLACRYELHDSTGRDFSAGRFPRTEEAALLGTSALARSRTGKDERVVVSMAVDPTVRDEARKLLGPDGFPPKELALRFAVDAVSQDGTRSTSGTRLVRVPLAPAASPASDL